MNRSMLAVLICIFCLVPNSAVAKFSAMERSTDAMTIISTLSHRYGPLKWKKEYMEIDFIKLSNRFLYNAKKDQTDFEFYKLMAGYLQDLADAHVSSKAPTTFKTYLPIDFDYIEGEYVLEQVNREELPYEAFPFERGDELIAMDGVAIPVIIKQLRVLNDEGYEPTTIRYLTGLLTYRKQSMFIDVPTGDVSLSLRSRTDGRVREATLTWQESGEPMAESSPEENPWPFASASDLTLDTELLSSLAPLENQSSVLDRLRNARVDLAGKKSWSLGSFAPQFPLWDNFIPRFGPGSDSRPFYFTGTFEHDGHVIGFLRLPAWSPDMFGPWKEVLAWLGNEIRWLQENTEALVIDQTFNPGGDVCYCESIFRMFLDKPTKPLSFEVRANRNWLIGVEKDYESYGDVLPAPDKVLLKQLLENIRSAIAEGKYMTDPVRLCDPREMIDPWTDESGVQTSYTKPILMLINELDFSGGDAFPAQMQDAGRATLFGHRTAGAGGTVGSFGPFGFSDLTFRITESLMWRAKSITLEDGSSTNYVENVGVRPDIEYDITMDDFLNGYRGYQNAIAESVISLIE
jgi:peptidase S41-like protein/PDZ domain-containing protein